jgi:hypothetical protein
MKVSKEIWDEFMDNNNFNTTPILTHPILGRILDPKKDQTYQILNIKEETITNKPIEWIEIPDDWILPITKKGRPPLKNQRIYAYILSAKGLQDNKERLAKGYKYQKATFQEFVNCVLNNAEHYSNTCKRRNTRQTDFYFLHFKKFEKEKKGNK